MRVILWALIAAGACSDPSIDPGVDAGTDDSGIPTGSTYWPCYFWDDVSATLEKCAPKCANRTLLGRTFWGSCEYAPGVECDPGNMTGPAGEPGSACCVYSMTPFERVDVVACQSAGEQ